MLKLTFLAISIHFFTSGLFSQKANDVPLLYTKNHFSYLINNGFNQSRFENKTGSETPYASLGYSPEVELKYVFNTNQKLGIGVNIAVGLFPSITHYNEQKEFETSLELGYFEVVRYRAFIAPKIDLNYRFFSTKRFIFNSSSGLGAKCFQEKTYVYGFGSSDGNYTMLLRYNTYPKLFLSPQISAFLLLKNNDLVGLNFNATLSFNNIHYGEFGYNSNTSTGIIYNSGNALGIGIQYVFTRAMSNMDKAIAREEKHKQKQETRKSNKEQKRFIDSKAIMVGAGVGMFNCLTKLSPNSSDLTPILAEIGQFHFDFQVGLRNNFFVETMWHTQRYFSLIRALKTDGSFGFGRGYVAYTGNLLNSGLGYRWINPKTNYNYITISSGVGALMIFSRKGASGYSGGYTSSSTDYFEFNSNEFIRRNIVPTFYFKVSKDFKLHSKFIVALAYKFDLGILENYYSDNQYKTNVSDDYSYVKTSINGTSNTFTLTMRYILGKRNNE